MRGALLTLACISLGFSASACPRSAPPTSSPAPVEAAARATRADVAEVMYDGGLQSGWQDWGWSPKELVPNGPAKIRFDQYGGWMLAKPGLVGEFGGVLFRVLEPAGEGEFLEVHLISSTGAVMPKIKVGPDDRVGVGDGWTEVFVPMERLDPSRTPFDRVVLQAFRPFGAQPVPVDKIALTKAVPHAAALTASAPVPVEMSIDCRAKAIRISPLIYGAVPDATKGAQLGATAARWGGNLSSTYNFEVNAWNAGSDWFFENREAPSAAQFLRENAAHGMRSALTVPMMGWVAKDQTSYSFPVSALGQQEKTDPYRSDVGNGKDKSGRPLTTSRERAYIPITAAYVKRWIEAIRKEDAKTGKRSVDMYILDNEPMLWPTTHRDVHPEPTSYDELVARTIEYGTAIREADPDAVIAGPAEWGWTGYFYSAKDQASGGTSTRLDRRAHGDLPIVAYYLKALAEHEKKTGVRVLDVLDLHSYPAADGVYGDAVDPAKAALRIRSTRLLWDPSYVDESWIKEPVKLLPRMRAWVDENYPGRGLSVGEWNFGGEQHMSGALAIAETFGRFAQFGVTSAFYWIAPPPSSPGVWAFRAYRDYDGKGGHFLDWFTAASVDQVGRQSLFASRDESGKHLVAVALNFSPADAVTAHIDVASCGKVASMQSYSYAGGASGFMAAPASAGAATKVVQTLPAYSITVLDVQLEGSSPIVRSH
jgi:hypothetical protein